MNPDGRSLCRACARRARTLICDGGLDVEAVADVDDEPDERLPSPSRAYTRREYRSLKPGVVITKENHYSVDHVDALSETVRLVNYDESGELVEVVEFPWHRIKGIEWLPAETAREESPYDGSDPLAEARGTRGEADE